MTRNELIKLICEYEGLKSQVSVGNVREILKVLKNIWDGKHGDLARNELLKILITIK